MEPNCTLPKGGCACSVGGTFGFAGWGRWEGVSTVQEVLERNRAQKQCQPPGGGKQGASQGTERSPYKGNPWKLLGWKARLQEQSSYKDTGRFVFKSWYLMRPLAGFLES